MSDVGLGPLVRWLDRCQGVRQPLASAFLATRPRDDLDALAADLGALTAGLPAFCAQVPPGVEVVPSADARAGVRGLGTLIHYLRRCADVHVDEPLAALFLSGKVRTYVEPLADQLRGLRVALRVFRDPSASTRARPTRPGARQGRATSRVRPVRPVYGHARQRRQRLRAYDVVVLGVPPPAAVAAPDRVDPVPVDLEALTVDTSGAPRPVAEHGDWDSGGHRAPAARRRKAR